MTAKEVRSALYYLMTEIWEYSPDKGESEITKRAHSDLQSALSKLEAIKSADGGEALEALKLLDKEWQTGEELETEEQFAHCSALENAGDILENYILKAQAQEEELRELKLTNAIAVTKIRSVLKDCRISKIKRYCIDDELKEICPTIYKNDGDAILETIKTFAKEVKSDE